MSEATFKNFQHEKEKADQQAMRALLGLLAIMFIFMNVYIQMEGSAFQRIAVPVETLISILAIIIGSRTMDKGHAEPIRNTN